MKRVAGLALAAAGAGAFVHTRVRETAELHPPRGRFAAGLHYIEAGHGPPLVLLHGLGAMLEDFELSGLFALAARRFRVFAFDRAGYGHSEARTLDPRAQAALLHQAFEEIGIARPVIVAHSAGTQSALAYAQQFPRELRGLVLMSGYYYPSVRPDVLLLAPPGIPVIGTLLRHTISPLVARLLWPAWLKLLFHPLPVPEYLPPWRALAPGQLRSVGVESAMLLPVTMRMRREYWKVRTPTVIVAGAKDRYVSSEAHSQRLHEELRFSTYLEIPEAGHIGAPRRARRSDARDLRRRGVTGYCVDALRCRVLAALRIVKQRRMLLFGSEKFMQHPEVEIYARTLARAAVLSGGREALAKKLNVSPDQLDAWIAGADEAPAAVFLLAVDLLMEDTLATLRERPVG